MKFDIIWIEEVKEHCIFKSDEDNCLFLGTVEECNNYIKIIPNLIKSIVDYMDKYSILEALVKTAREFDVKMHLIDTLYRDIIQYSL